jgi:hypothetical protein
MERERELEVGIEGVAGQIQQVECGLVANVRHLQIPTCAG